MWKNHNSETMSIFPFYKLRNVSAIHRREKKNQRQDKYFLYYIAFVSGGRYCSCDKELS